MTVPNWSNAQVIAQLDSGGSWTGAVLTYAFPASRSGMYGDDWEKPGFIAVSPSQQNLMRLALTLWDDLIPQSLVETTSSSSNIEFGYSTTMSGYAHAYLPSTGSVWFSAVVGQDADNSTTSPTIGLFGFETVLHEIGHALGLNHMGDYESLGNDQPSSYQDSTVYSIMSYFGPGGSAQSPDVAQADWTGTDGVDHSPQTPMLNDIMAIQSIYGVSKTTRSNDTIYGFGCNIADSTAAIFDFALNRHPILTIFDSGGIDTLDLSGWSAPSVIRLESGAYSSCNSMTDNIAIAYTSVVENATGGSGDDRITGNSAANVLKGNAGDDVIDGGAGDDTLVGGAGNDRLTGGSGSDVAVFAGAFSRYVTSYSQITASWTLASTAEGTDVVAGVEFFQFSDGLRDASLNRVHDMQVLPPAGGLALNGDGAANILIGQGGSDILAGLAGNDVLIGLAGNDSLDGGAGLDTVVYSNNRADYTVTQTASGLSVSGLEGTDTLAGIERLHFADVTLAFDIDGGAGQVYRLYQTAFNRVPDQGGLGSWISGVDHGLTLLQVASGFIGSAEFQSLYGANPTNTQFVTLLYNNVLHRAPDAGGYGYWVNQLASGAQTREQVLTGFSESPENKAALVPAIQNGIAYIEPQHFTGSASADVLIGTASADTLSGMAGNDILIGLGGNDNIDGGAGIDTAVYVGNRSTHTITHTGSGLTVVSPAGVDGTDTLINVERLQFADVNLAFDVDGNAGQTYRLYQAAFDRSPDLAGLGSWIGAMDQGLTLLEVAHGFIGSVEFQSLYGANPGNGQFVTLLYDNVLHRAPDAGGYGYWVDQLASGAQTREQVLTGFSESAENQLALIGVIQNGMAYLPG